MSEQQSGMSFLTAKNQAEAKDLVEKLFNVTKPEAVFSEPLKVGEYTLITASETSVSMGFGFGMGGSDFPVESEGEGDVEIEISNPVELGGGGGGGGYSMGRAVAVVSVSPDGVKIDPIVDVTKVALAFFTMFGGMMMALFKMIRAAKGAK